VKITHDFLVQKGAKWLSKEASNVRYRSQYVVTEFSSQGSKEIPDIFGLRPSGHVMIEVKVSRGDFKADVLKEGRDQRKLQLGNFRFYLVPEGMIKGGEIPITWGLLEWTGDRVKLTQNATHVPQDGRAVQYMYHSIISRMFDYTAQVLDFRHNTYTAKKTPK
jgi:hypothetical protein